MKGRALLLLFLLKKNCHADSFLGKNLTFVLQPGENDHLGEDKPAAKNQGVEKNLAVFGVERGAEEVGGGHEGEKAVDVIDDCR